MDENDLTRQSALDLAETIRTGKASAQEVTAAHLDRIDAVNPSVHAVVQISDVAMDEAALADATLSRGETTGPLHGVPFTVKDWIETKGLICDAGHEARRDFVPREDATVVARMRAAGGILLGKTKTGSTADLHRAPKNPFNSAHTPGASSSGEVAIIASGGSPLGLGSDSGGSLRWPAHCCGVATLKPTSGLVPGTGHVPPTIALSDPRTVIGPFARSVDDLGTVLKVIAGEDGKDASTLPVPPGDPGSVSPGSLRVAWFAEFEGAVPDDATLGAMEEAVKVFEASGASLTHAAPPRIDEAMRITKAYWARPESSSANRWAPWGESTLSADDVERSLFEWDRLRRAFTAFMSDFDLVICPAAATAAPARAEALAGDYIYTLPFSLTGQPVAVVRTGTSGNGLPLGVQVAARPFRDHIALAGASLLERRAGPFPPPSIEAGQASP
jgi:amidase